MKRLLLLFLLLFLLPLCASADTLTLDCTDELSLSTFVQTVRSRNITGDTLVIADKDICAREMIAVKTETDAEGNKEYILAQDRVAAGVKAQASLDDIDARSIRSIREWLVQQPTASQALKDLETQAIALRKQLQGGDA